MRTTCLTWIVTAELFGTALWFSVTAAPARPRVGESGRRWLADERGAGRFHRGTLAIALSGLAGSVAAEFSWLVRFRGANAMMPLLAQSAGQAVLWRLLTGVALAGIYPMGMKLVVGWAPHRAGEMLGWLVGMLAIGTALPHLMRACGGSLAWQTQMLAASGLALTAGAIVWRLGDGPHAVNGSPAGRIGWGRVLGAFRVPAFRFRIGLSATCGSTHADPDALPGRPCSSAPRRRPGAGRWSLPRYAGALGVSLAAG
jgi:MFS family permease